MKNIKWWTQRSYISLTAFNLKKNQSFLLTVLVCSFFDGFTWWPISDSGGS